MAGVRTDIDMASANNTFPLLNLPEELRALVLSHIILEPTDQITESKHPYCTPEEEKYLEQRRLCHTSAKSLLLVSKQIHIETIRQFYKHKTVVLTTPGLEFSMLGHGNNALHRMNEFSINRIRNIEFGLKLSQEDINCDFIQLRSQLIQINNLFKSNISHLPRLRSVTFRLVQSFNWKDDRPFGKVDTIELNNAFTSTRRPLATKLAGSTSVWKYHSEVGSDYVKFLLDECSPFYQYADGLNNGVVGSREWACSRSIYKCTWKQNIDALEHELKFQWKENMGDSKPVNSWGGLGLTEKKKEEDDDDEVYTDEEGIIALWLEEDDVNYDDDNVWQRAFEDARSSWVTF